MEHQRVEIPVPSNHAFDPDVLTKQRAAMLAERLEHGLNLGPQEKGPTIVGVALFELDANCRTLTPWNPQEKRSHNGAMTGAYERVDFEKPYDGSKDYCRHLLIESGISEYLHHRGGALKNHNVIVHLHYYRSRPKPDAGFHKDTRGQTLFFMLHFLNDKPIFGPEWVRDRGLSVKVSTSGERSEGARSSPALVDSVWPQSIRQDVLAKKSEAEEDDIHVLRVGTCGAVLVVDDIVHHRTPNPRARAEWGNIPQTRAPQVSTVQARDAEHQNSLYEIPRGRKLERESSSARGRSRSRSLSREREKKEGGDPGATARWDATFDDTPRRFFRIWVTVSPKGEEVWY